MFYIPTDVLRVVLSFVPHIHHHCSVGEQWCGTAHLKRVRFNVDKQSNNALSLLLQNKPFRLSLDFHGSRHHNICDAVAVTRSLTDVRLIIRHVTDEVAAEMVKLCGLHRTQVFHLDFCNAVAITEAGIRDIVQLCKWEQVTRLTLQFGYSSLKNRRCRYLSALVALEFGCVKAVNIFCLIWRVTIRSQTLERHACVSRFTQVHSLVWTWNCQTRAYREK